MANYWLAKQEPDGSRGYNFEQLVSDGTTVWDGVHNNLALQYMQKMKKGDLAFFYHTGTERQIMGIMEIVRNPYPNPSEDNPRFIAVDVRYKKHLENPVTLQQIKMTPGFEDWELLRISRLSVMPVPRDVWGIILKMSKISPA